MSDGLIPESPFTPTYSSPHMAPGASAYGTHHPIDRALGRAYRLKSLAGAARGSAPSHSERLMAAAQAAQSGHVQHHSAAMLQPTQFVSAGGPNG